MCVLDNIPFHRELCRTYLIAPVFRRRTEGIGDSSRRYWYCRKRLRPIASCIICDRRLSRTGRRWSVKITGFVRWRVVDLG
jgi:hypothetical protein